MHYYLKVSSERTEDYHQIISLDDKNDFYGRFELIVASANEPPFAVYRFFPFSRESTPYVSNNHLYETDASCLMAVEDDLENAGLISKIIDLEGIIRNQ